MRKSGDDVVCSIMMTIRALKLTRYSMRVARQHEQDEKVQQDLDVAVTQISEIIESPWDDSDQHRQMTGQMAPPSFRRDN
jgi:hypothetical protein